MPDSDLSATRRPLLFWPGPERCFDAGAWEEWMVLAGGLPDGCPHHLRGYRGERRKSLLRGLQQCPHQAAPSSAAHLQPPRISIARRGGATGNMAGQTTCRPGAATRRSWAAPELPRPHIQQHIQCLNNIAAAPNVCLGNEFCQCLSDLRP